MSPSVDFNQTTNYFAKWYASNKKWRWQIMQSDGEESASSKSNKSILKRGFQK